MNAKGAQESGEQDGGATALVADGQGILNSGSYGLTLTWTRPTAVRTGGGAFRNGFAAIGAGLESHEIGNRGTHIMRLALRAWQD